jgi:hypothetical protein
MKHRSTQHRPLINPEVVMNLWAYTGEDGSIMRLAGKTYVMQGIDDEKLALLRQLSASDFLSAPWEKVPANFVVNNADGESMQGLAQASMITDPYYHQQLFGPLIEKLAKLVPEQLRSVVGEYEKFRLDLPESPLSVTTIVMEYENGTLVPMVSG